MRSVLAALGRAAAAAAAAAGAVALGGGVGGLVRGGLRARREGVGAWNKSWFPDWVWT